MATWRASPSAAPALTRKGIQLRNGPIPLNRLQQSVAPLSYEASPGLPAPGTEDASGHGRAKASRAFRTPYRDKIHSHPVPRSSRKARSKALGMGAVPAGAAIELRPGDQPGHG